jgi:hypothetical protein
MENNKYCHCGKCVTVDLLKIFPMIISCNICGQNLCPRAADHDFECVNVQDELTNPN